MSIDSTVLSTPTGPLSILVGPDGDVRAAGFTPDPAALLPLVHPTLRAPLRQRADLGPVSTAVQSYLDGDLAAIDAVPVRQRTGGEFMAHAWQVLREVPPGDPGHLHRVRRRWPAGRRRCGPPRPPAPGTRRPSSCPATGCSAPTGRSAATAGGWT